MMEIKIQVTTGFTQDYSMRMCNSMPRRIQQVLGDKEEATKYQISVLKV
jgi:hypothetical protein